MKRSMKGLMALSAMTGLTVVATLALQLPASVVSDDVARRLYGGIACNSAPAKNADYCQGCGTVINTPQGGMGKQTVAFEHCDMYTADNCKYPYFTDCVDPP